MSISLTETRTIFEDYLSQLEKAFVGKDINAIEELFLQNGWLRDILITEWDFNSIPKADGGLKAFFDSKGVPSIHNFTIHPTKSAPVFVEAAQWIQGFFTFESPTILGEGFVRLQKDTSTATPQSPWKAFTLSFLLDSFAQFPAAAGHNRPFGVVHGGNRPTTNWQDEREALINSHTPQVLIVGAGHGGLMLAARLRRQGIHALLIDKNKRLGDSWRKRYHSLVLHDVVWGNHFPYLKFPDDWPVFIPKDKIANWFESYASIMELNVWLESQVEPESTKYDEQTGRWSLQIRRGDGTIADITCSHVVQATGHAGEPNVPNFVGLKDFKGTAVHSSQFKTGGDWRGKKAVVIGCCNSGHDIAQELYNNGAEVTMVQRSETLVISSGVGLRVLLEPSYSETSAPLEEADASGLSFPLTPLKPIMVQLHKAVCDADKPMLDGLAKAGFKVGGLGGPGLVFKYWADGGGYYIDVGASQLIVDGKIKIKQGQQVERFVENGVKFEDGSVLEADIVVLATGYQSMRETCRKIFGSKVADRTGPVWGLDKQGEIQGIWRSSDHPGFWYMGGNFVLARIYSQYLALQIKAIEEGLAPGKKSQSQAQ